MSRACCAARSAFSAPSRGVAESAAAAARRADAVFRDDGGAGTRELQCLGGKADADLRQRVERRSRLGSAGRRTGCAAGRARALGGEPIDEPRHRPGGKACATRRTASFAARLRCGGCRFRPPRSHWHFPAPASSNGTAPCAGTRSIYPHCMCASRPSMQAEPRCIGAAAAPALAFIRSVPRCLAFIVNSKPVLIRTGSSIVDDSWWNYSHAR